MLFRRYLLLVLTVGFWGMLTPSSWAMGLEIAGGGWLQDPSGTFGYKIQGPADYLDVGNNLGYDHETRIFGRAKIDMPLFLPNIYLMASPSKFEGTGSKSTGFHYDNENFVGNVDFYSKLIMNQYDIGLYYGLPFLNTLSVGMLNVELGFNVRVLDVQAEVSQASSGAYEKFDGTLPVPQLYAGVQFQPLDWLALEAEGRGITISDDQVYSVLGRLRSISLAPRLLPAVIATTKLMWILIIQSQFRDPGAICRGGP